MYEKYLTLNYLLNYIELIYIYSSCLTTIFKRLLKDMSAVAISTNYGPTKIAICSNPAKGP